VAGNIRTRFGGKRMACTDCGPRTLTRMRGLGAISQSRQVRLSAACIFFLHLAVEKPVDDFMNAILPARNPAVINARYPVP
jgi:hypothetical protein